MRHVHTSEFINEMYHNQFHDTGAPLPETPCSQENERISIDVWVVFFRESYCHFIRPNLGSDGTADYESGFCQTTWRTWNNLPFSVTQIGAWLMLLRAKVAYVKTRIGITYGNGNVV